MNLIARRKTLKAEKARLIEEAQGALEAAASENRDLTADERAHDDAVQARVAQINDELGRIERVLEEDREAPAVEAPAAPTSGFGSFGDFLVAVAQAGMPGGRVDQRLLPIQAGPTGMSSGVPADGGFLVRRDWSTQLLARATEQAQLLPRTRQVPIGEGFDGIELPFLDETSRATGSRWGGVRVYRRGEADTVTATKPKVGKIDLQLEDLMGLAYVTNRLLRDGTALSAVLEPAFASEFAFQADDEIFRGDGVGKMLGILNSNALVTVSKESGQAANTVVAANIAKMYARMPARLIGGSAWFVNQEVLPQLFTMTLSNQPIYMPGGTIANAPYGLLYGRPVVPIEQASALSSVGDITFANLGEYLTITKGGIEAAESMHVRFIYAEMAFRWIYRINGQPLWKSALTPYKGSASQSPFIVLEAR